MKTKIIFQISVCFITLLGTQSTFSQDNSSKNEKYNFYALIEAVKNNPDAFAAEPYGTSTATVNDKIAKSFKKYFGSAAEQNWSVVDGNFLNRFHSNGVLTNALFSKNGNLIYTITYGTEKNMPEDIRKIVKSEYYDYSITMAIEVQQDKRDIWVVKVDNADEQITVRVEDGEMEAMQKFDKSK